MKTRTVALIKFTSREDFDKCTTPEHLRFLKNLKAPMDYDQILVFGTVSGHEILEIRFIKYYSNEQTVCKVDNGDPGQ